MGTVDGVYGDYILVAPPLTVQEQEIREIVLEVAEAYKMVAELVAGTM
jgi:adenosylmethionine-8-amino-7-oxononanoate aminotransferase